MKSQSVTIHMKAVEYCFPPVLFIMLYKVVLTFESLDKILNSDHSTKATEQFFPMVIMLFPNFLSVYCETFSQ